ncbi:MAG: hypothetical protein QOH93_1515 [Chloroflexia bacterium]|nr:hypothetical protein [Chloroflexia bacterium]
MGRKRGSSNYGLRLFNLMLYEQPEVVDPLPPTKPKLQDPKRPILNACRCTYCCTSIVHSPSNSASIT